VAGRETAERGAGQQHGGEGRATQSAAMIAVLNSLHAWLLLEGSLGISLRLRCRHGTAMGAT
jgi:uncharacterized Ntn-hydrolase superfamily protein